MLNKSQLRNLLKEAIIEHDYTILNKFDNKIANRVYDFYVGYCLCFNKMKEEPINKEEFDVLVKEEILNYFRDLTKE